MFRAAVFAFLLASVSTGADSDALVKYGRIPGFTPVDGYARVVIIRHKGQGPRTGDDVMFYIDRQFVSAATEYCIVSFPVEPGTRYLTGCYDDNEDEAGSAVCTFAPGKVYYFHCVNFFMFSFAGRNIVLMTPISPKKMQDIMAEASEPVHYYEYDWRHPDAEAKILDRDDWEEIVDHHNDWAKDNREDYGMQLNYMGF